MHSFTDLVVPVGIVLLLALVVWLTIKQSNETDDASDNTYRNQATRPQATAPAGPAPSLQPAVAARYPTGSSVPSDNDSSDLLLSAGVAAATDSTVLGYLAGGSLLGAIVGESIADSQAQSVSGDDPSSDTNDTCSSDSSSDDSSSNDSGDCDSNSDSSDW